MSKKCAICDDQLTDGVRCSVCGNELHFQCAGITEAGHRKLGDRKFSWRCMKCKQTCALQPPGSPVLPRPETESAVLLEIRALAAKLAPLEGLKDEILALRSEFADMKSSINQQFNEVVKEFNGRISDLEQRVVGLEKVQGQIDQLQVRLDKLEEDSDNGDQWSRMNNVEVKGLMASNNENLFQIISSIGAKINYPIVKSQINFITRVPTREKDRIKPVIVSFCNRYVKEDFVAAARYVSKTSPLTTSQIGLAGNQRIFINDHLTTKNKILLSKAKKLASEMDFQYVWVKHSKIHLRKMDTTPVVIVKSEKDLSKIF